MCNLDDLYAQTEETPSGCYVWLGARTARGGYGRIGVKTAQRVVMERLVGPLPPSIQVCHHCDNPPCIRREHLFLGLAADNIRDMWSKGRGKAPGGRLRGSQIQSSKLVESQVAEIRQKLRAGGTRNGLAREYGVSQRTIALIKNGSVWKHVA